MIFEDQEVGYASGEMNADSGGQQAQRVVGRDCDVVGLCRSRDLLAFHDSAAHAQVRLNDVNGLSVEQGDELVQVV